MLNKKARKKQRTTENKKEWNGKQGTRYKGMQASYDTTAHTGANERLIAIIMRWWRRGSANMCEHIKIGCARTRTGGTIRCGRTSAFLTRTITTWTQTSKQTNKHTHMTTNNNNQSINQQHARKFDCQCMATWKTFNKTENDTLQCRTQHNQKWRKQYSQKQQGAHTHSLPTVATTKAKCRGKKQMMQQTLGHNSKCRNKQTSYSMDSWCCIEWHNLEVTNTYKTYRNK